MSLCSNCMPIVWPFHWAPSDMNTAPACFCAALPAGQLLMPWFPLHPPASTQVLPSKISPVLGLAGCSSLYFCPLQSTLCPMPSSCRTLFFKLWAPARCVTFISTQFPQRTIFPTPCSMQWPPMSGFRWHLLQWFYSRSWDIAQPCKWLPQNSDSSKSHWCRASLISPSLSEPSPALSKEVWFSV